MLSKYGNLCMGCDIRKRAFIHVRPAFVQSDQNIVRISDSQGRKVSCADNDDSDQTARMPI